MLLRLDEPPGQGLRDVEARLAELTRLRDETDRYRGRIASRFGSLGSGARRAR